MSAATISGKPFIGSFRHDGTVMNLADLQVDDIDFATMALSLAKMARFNGTNAAPGMVSVAQHSVMGADALDYETGDKTLAGYFLLHDGHEYIIGDQTRPTACLLDHIQAREHRRRFPESRDGCLTLRHVIDIARAEIDAVIVKAARMPALDLMPVYRRQVAAMDERMLRAEGLALFGEQAAPHLPAADLPPPKLVGAIIPWTVKHAHDAFIDRLERYCGVVVRARI